MTDSLGELEFEAENYLHLEHSIFFLLQVVAAEKAGAVLFPTPLISAWGQSETSRDTSDPSLVSQHVQSQADVFSASAHPGPEGPGWVVGVSCLCLSCRAGDAPPAPPAQEGQEETPKQASFPFGSKLICITDCRENVTSSLLQRDAKEGGLARNPAHMVLEERSFAMKSPSMLAENSGTRLHPNSAPALCCHALPPAPLVNMGHHVAAPGQQGRVPGAWLLAGLTAS